MKKLLLPIISLTLGIATAGANVIINPPAPTSSANYTASFTETDSGGIYSYSETAGPEATPGIAIVTPTGGTNSGNYITYNTGFTFGLNTPQYASLMFLYGNGTTSAFGVDTRVAALGFSSSGSTPGESTGTGFRLFQTGGSGSTLAPTIRNNGNTITPAGASNIQLNDATWYQLQVSLTKTATTDIFNYTFALNQLNNSGSFVSNVFNYSGNLTNAGSYVNTRFISFYGGNDNNGTGATAFANLSTIPEPTTWALLAGSLTTLMVFRRRAR